MGAWGYLAAAIVLEVLGTSLLKLSDGFAKWHWGMLSIACYSDCFWVLSPALKTIPVGTAYAIWAGVGIVAIAVIGALIFGQRLGLLQYGCIGLILVGAIGLRLTTSD